MAIGFVLWEVPGATPKNPASGLIAYRRPSFLLNFIHAMSSPVTNTFPYCSQSNQSIRNYSNSPTTLTFHPGTVGSSMARLVFPQAEGKAAATNLSFPSGLVIPMIWNWLVIIHGLVQSPPQCSLWLYSHPNDQPLSPHQHVFSHPSFVSSNIACNSQGETFLAQQRISSCNPISQSIDILPSLTVSRSERPDFSFLGTMSNENLLGIAWPMIDHLLYKIDLWSLPPPLSLPLLRLTGRGRPTEWIQRTKSLSPRESSTFVPIRVIVRMQRTT